MQFSVLVIYLFFTTRENGNKKNKRPIEGAKPSQHQNPHRISVLVILIFILIIYSDLHIFFGKIFFLVQFFGKINTHHIYTLSFFWASSPKPARPPIKSGPIYRPINLPLNEMDVFFSPLFSQSQVSQPVLSSLLFIHFWSSTLQLYLSSGNFHFLACHP